MENQSTEENTWTDEDGLRYRELIRQEYTNCAFYGGQVLNHPVDRLYLFWQKGESSGGMMLRPDEVAALAWICSGLLWSHHLDRVQEDGSYDYGEVAGRPE